jgi:hypothetical protein
MQCTVLTPASYKTLRLLLGLSFGLGFATILYTLFFALDNPVLRFIGPVLLLIFFTLSRYYYLVFPKQTLFISPDGLKFGEEGDLLTPEKITAIDLDIGGYKGELSFSQHAYFKGTGFNNIITIKMPDRELKTHFLLENPNEEKEVVSLLIRHFKGTSRRRL